MVQLLWQVVRQILKKLNIELPFPYDPAIPLLGIELKDLGAGSRTDICIPVFTAALFTIAKRRKEPKCPPTDEWISSVDTHTGLSFSLKKEGNCDTRCNMDAP